MLYARHSGVRELLYIFPKEWPFVNLVCVFPIINRHASAAGGGGCLSGGWASGYVLLRRYPPRGELLFKQLHCDISDFIFGDKVDGRFKLNPLVNSLVWYLV